MNQVKHGKPVSPPLGAGRPQGMLLVMRVKECGESECRPVMGRIGVEPQGNIIPRESGQTSTWSFSTRSEEHTSELQSLMRISYAVFCLTKKKIHRKQTTTLLNRWTYET